MRTSQPETTGIGPYGWEQTSEERGYCSWCGNHGHRASSCPHQPISEQPFKSTLKRKKGLNRVSKKRKEDLARRKEVREKVIVNPCVFAGHDEFGPCYGKRTPHHVKRSGQGGSYDETNIVSACAYHNDLVESDADAARLAEQLGLVKRSWGMINTAGGTKMKVRDLS